MSQTVKIVVAISLLVVLAVGGVVSFALVNKPGSTLPEKATKTTTESVAIATSAADLRVSLNNLQTQHIILLTSATRLAFDKSKQLEPTETQLDQNTKALAAVIGSVYGDDKRDKFYDIWSSQIRFFIDYAKASKTGDQTAKDKSIENLNEYAQKVTIFLSTTNPNLQKDALAQMVTENVGLIKQAIDRYRKAGLASSYEVESVALEQATTKIADTLAMAIVKQKPERFKP